MKNKIFIKIPDLNLDLIPQPQHKDLFQSQPFVKHIKDLWSIKHACATATLLAGYISYKCFHFAKRNLFIICFTIFFAINQENKQNSWVKKNTVKARMYPKPIFYCVSTCGGHIHGGSLYSGGGGYIRRFTVKVRTYRKPNYLLTGAT
jgi:hypothetical protein